MRARNSAPSIAFKQWCLENYDANEDDVSDAYTLANKPHYIYQIPETDRDRILSIKLPTYVPH